MSKLTLDSVEWGEFKIKDIFEIETVKGKPVENYENGEIPYVSTASINNAVINFIHKDEKIITKGFSITVDPIKGSCFFHEYDFVGRGFSGASVNVLRNKKLNKFNGIFICSAIEKTSKSKASYGYLFNSNRLKNGILLLPIGAQGNPNWQFMEDYIKQEMKEQSQKVANYYENKLLKLGFEFLDLEVEWKEFWIEEILSVKSGVRLTKSDQISGKIPFIGASDSSNGITEFVGNTNKSLDKNVLGVNYNGSVVENFYHFYECIFSDDVKRIKFKNEDCGDEYTYLFLKQVILQQKNKYQYGYKFNAKRMNRQKIILPVDENGQPHWEYMSQFIQKLKISKISKILEYIYIYILENNLNNIYLLDNTAWKEYFIEDVCKIYSGKDIYERERIQGDIPYVTATASNNGIGYFVNNTNKTKDKNCISVNRNGSVGHSFYHNYEALFGNDTRKLKSKYENEYVGKFISFMISEQKGKYGYGYKMGTGRLKRQKIMLPSDKEGKPNYDFMKKCIIMNELKHIKKILKFLK